MDDLPPSPADFDEEEFGEVSKSEPEPEPKKEAPKKQEPQEIRDPKISLDIDELNQFLSEVSRLSVVIEKTSSSLKTMEGHTAIVERLRNIAEFDMSAFKYKFESLVKDLDLERYAKEAIADTLAPIQKEYKDSNDLLKNFIFELEKSGNFKAKTVHRCKLKSIFLSFVFGVSVGVGGLFLAQNFELPAQQEVVQNEPAEVEIFMREGTPVLELETQKQRNIPTGGMSSIADNTNPGYFDFKYKGIWYRIARAQATVVKNGN